MGIESKDVTFTIQVTKTVMPDTYPDRIANTVDEAADYEVDSLMSGGTTLDEFIGDDEITVTYEIHE